MITWDNVRQTVYATVITEFAAHHATVKIVPVGQALPDLTTFRTPFVTIAIQPRASAQSALAGQTPPKRKSGAAEFVVFVPANQGLSTTLGLVETLDSLFTAKVLSGITFTQTTMLKSTQGLGWTSQVLLASFHFDNFS